MIHLGVNGFLSQMAMEMYGYNCADFGIPDERGWIACQEKISLECDLNHPICTTLDTERLLEVLQKNKVLIDASTDPGRYICNYVYYHSLLWTKQQPHKRVRWFCYTIAQKVTILILL